MDLHVICPHCTATNRVPEARLADGARCGRCSEALFLARPTAVDAAAFARHLAGDLPLLVDFWAPWCGPCRIMAPHFETAAGQLEPRVRLLKIDTEAERELGARHGIRSIPTLALFRAGREVARQAGAISAADIVGWTRQALADQ